MWGWISGSTSCNDSAEICSRACAMDATLVYSDTRFVSIIIDGKITSGLNILDTMCKVELNCSEFMSKKFREYQKLPGPYNNDKQCFCIAAILFQKYAAADSSLDALEDNQELWDEAVEQVFDSYPEPFSLTIQDVATNSVEFPM
jgi:hypothetical protein